ALFACSTSRLSVVISWHLLRRIPQQQSAIAHRRIGGGSENSSFNTDQPVIVTVEHGKLVIKTELRF
ncbi:type I toxin-antitoxin system SymE family toxin, partial [Pectobacterium versatile]|uniref:type I toxin-antitoxin system SymE family toxin n=1 Tax=Pectobacterium versatile TaxID=2488639 RepID=UPI001CCFDB87